MVYKPNLETSRPGRALVQARQWGVGMITASVGVGMLVSEIQRLQATIATPLTIGYLSIFGITGVLIFLWIWATSKELDLCFEWLDPERYAPPSSIKETLLIIGIGIVLSLLLFAARDPFYYGAVFTLYSGVVTYAYYYTKSEVRQAIGASRHRLEQERGGESARLAAEYSKAVDVLETYFLFRPQTTRHIIILVLSGIGMSVGLIWRVNGQEAFALVAYGLLGSTIVISEAIIARWRLARDGELRPIGAEISELSRAQTSTRNS